MRKRLLTLGEVADRLRVPEATVRRWLYRGDGPPALKVGRHLRFDEDRLEEWLGTRPGPGRRRRREERAS
jgi:excisionase family DNA binding protein